MASRLNPYLTFDGNAREAMEFYQQVFGGTLTANTFGEYGDPGAEGADKIMHAQLETPDGFTLMGSDSPPGMEFNPGNTITISLSGDGPEGESLRGYFERLGEGGTVTMPLERQMWGDDFGMLIDRFGVAWMVNIAGEQA